MEDPGLTPGAAVDPLELAQARYSAFCDNGWHGIIQEDLGLLLHHAFGPSGHAYKWTNVHADSAWIMHPRKGSKAAAHNKYPSYGIDELNSPKQRDALAKASNLGLVLLFMPCLNRAGYIGCATLEHLSTVIRDDIMMLAFPFCNYKE
eukprot:8227873-Pyramimonas_sp.AAC.1